MEKSLIHEYAKEIGLTTLLDEEFLSKLKLTNSYKRFVAEQKIRIISEELRVDVDFYMLNLLNIFDYSDIHEEYITENEVNSVLPVMLEVKSLFKQKGTVGIGHGRTAYGSAEERAEKLKQDEIGLLGRGVSLQSGGLRTGVYSKKGTMKGSTREIMPFDPHRGDVMKGKTGHSGQILTKPKIHKI